MKSQASELALHLQKSKMLWNVTSTPCVRLHLVVFRCRGNFTAVCPVRASLISYRKLFNLIDRLHWTTKFNFFFGPCTSVGELSSTFYAEFRYVYRIFLSGGVSKIQKNLFVQNSTLRSNETGINSPLKCRGV